STIAGDGHATREGPLEALSRRARRVERPVQRVSWTVEVDRSDENGTLGVADPDVSVLAARDVEAQPVPGEEDSHEGGIDRDSLSVWSRVPQVRNQRDRERDRAAVHGGQRPAVGRQGEAERFRCADAGLHTGWRDQAAAGEYCSVEPVDCHVAGSRKPAGWGC